MIPKSFDTIYKLDIEALIRNQVREGRSIEYKQVLPGTSDEEKREFLADVSSFANAGGGDLLYGISEIEGVPQKALGLGGNLDDALLRLENLLRDGLEPRIHGLRIRPIEGFSEGSVVVIRVPKSWGAPHMVIFKNLSRFFTRHSTGKHQLDVSEIRSAFLLTDALPERMRRFRDERLGRIIADETPVRLCKGAKLLLHILPISSFTTDVDIGISVLKERAIRNLTPIGSYGYSHRYNLDGFVNYSAPNDDGTGAVAAYSLIFRKGQIEAVYADLVREKSGKYYMPSISFEDYIIKAVLDYVGVLKSLEIPSPLAVFVCMTGVNGVSMGVNAFNISDFGTPIDRDMLVLPDILIDDYESLIDKNVVAGALRPIFDAVWNACGFEGSYNYDENGNWKPK